MFVNRMLLEVPASNAKNVINRNLNTNVVKTKNFPPVVQHVLQHAVISSILYRNPRKRALLFARLVVFANPVSIVQARTNVSNQKNAVQAQMNSTQLVVLPVQKHAILYLVSARNNVFEVVFASLRIMFAKITVQIVLVFLEKNVLLKLIE